MQLDKIRPKDIVEIKAINGDLFLAQVLKNKRTALWIVPLDPQYEEGLAPEYMITRHWSLQGRKPGRPSMDGEAIEIPDVQQIKPRPKMRNPFLDKIAS